MAAAVTLTMGAAIIYRSSHYPIDRAAIFLGSGHYPNIWFFQRFNFSTCSTFNFSTFQHVQHFQLFKIQHFNFSTFQHFQHFKLEGSKSFWHSGGDPTAQCDGVSSPGLNFQCPTCLLKHSFQNVIILKKRWKMFKETHPTPTFS